VYEDLYRRHWWFQSRERILLDVIRSLELTSPSAILDIGCGNGLFFPRLQEFGDVRGIEIDESLIPADSPYRRQIFTQPLGAACYRDLRFDLITALDVVEHIEDERQALKAMWDLLRPGGRLVITVPALTRLWDYHDELNRHYRRYSATSLRNVLPGGLRILDLRYLYHALCLPKIVLKTLNLGLSRKRAQHGIPPAAIGWVLKTACVWEYRLLRWLRLPFGTSLLLVAEKADLDGRQD
jgi:2-polyprenyl-3-methyl-5-hydroxy-6-metoxy-1,4-benzoquinol methylase